MSRGYPHKLAINSSNIIGPGVAVGSRIYVSVFAYSFQQREPFALYCWDTTTNETCGLIITDRPLANVGVSGSRHRVGQRTDLLRR